MGERSLSIFPKKTFFHFWKDERKTHEHTIKVVCEEQEEELVVTFPKFHNEKVTMVQNFNKNLKKIGTKIGLLGECATWIRNQKKRIKPYVRSLLPTGPTHYVNDDAVLSDTDVILKWIRSCVDKVEEKRHEW